MWRRVATSIGKATICVQFKFLASSIQKRIWSSATCVTFLRWPRSCTSAAPRNGLSITQPPLSLNIQQLEASVGARLFERDSKGVRLTAAGVAFRVSAQALLAKADEARLLAREIEAGSVGRLRVGFVGSVLFRGLPQWLAAFQAEHPRIEVGLSELNSQEQIDALMHDELDLGFVHTQRVPAELQTALVHSDAFMCCVNAVACAGAAAQGVAAAVARRALRAVLAQGLARLLHAHRRDVRCAGLLPEGAPRGAALAVRGVAGVAGHGRVGGAGAAGARRHGRRGLQALAEETMPSQVHCAWKAGIDHPARSHFLELVLA